MAEPMVTTDLPPIIREHLDAIVALARAYEVERLEIFGRIGSTQSAATLTSR